MSIQFVTPPSQGARRGASGETSKETLDFDGALLKFARDEEIFGEGEDADYVYQVVSGAVRTYRLLSDGRRQIEECCIEGDIFGLEIGVERRTTAEAIANTVLKVTKRAALAEKAASDGALAQKLWRMTARDLQRTREHILMLGRRTAAERVAGFLLEFGDRSACGREIDLPMSRQDIADYLGLTIETVSRTFTQLQGSGCVSVPACRHVVIRNEERLREMCE
jgi:CRP/FNR family nitrogen fixation transcriptional regulator